MGFSAGQLLRVEQVEAVALGLVVVDRLRCGARPLGASGAGNTGTTWSVFRRSRHFAEIRWLVVWLEEISGELGLVFALRYNDRDLGWIRRGVTDDTISEGLIAVWERALERLEHASPRC